MYTIKMENKKTALVKDIKLLVVIFAIIIVMLKILFFKESLFNIIKMTSSFYYLFILPGFSLLYYWKKELSFLERFVMGFATSLALVGVLGYYFGLVGIKLNIFAWMLPPIITFAGVYLYLYQCKVDKEKDETITN